MMRSRSGEMGNAGDPRGWAVVRNGGFQLARAGRPALLLGGQVHNSSSSSARSIAESFAHVRRMNGNTVLAPVSWALTEPEEGVFDFSLVDAMLREAQGNVAEVARQSAHSARELGVDRGTARHPRVDLEQLHP